jgi:structural maintenance of chromosome 3 (chondroitin sulfate proteoglycan 6)
MFLKRIILRGFKTYRDETVIEDFSEGCNLVLGKNGSGKSNLIDAIQFVLTNKYEGISAEVRLQLVYQGVGNEKMNQADVELTFDNTSKRIPVRTTTRERICSRVVDSHRCCSLALRFVASSHVQIEPAKGGGENATDVRLRRTIGLKKDQFLVNESPYSNVDFNNLIESIGLTRQEPYYIVQQGKIHKLIANSTEDNLNLCKEIAGTAIYDQRKKESKKIMKDTETKLTQIDAVITSLTSRLSELEEESAELKKYLVRTHARTRRHAFDVVSSLEAHRRTFVCLVFLGSRHHPPLAGVQHLRAGA